MAMEDEMVNPFAIIFVTSIVLAVFIFLLDFNYFDLGFNGNSNQHIIFYVLFEFNLRTVYKAQTKETMNTLLYGVQTIMKVHVERPAVLLLLAPTDSFFTALSIAKTLTTTILVAFGRHWTAKDLDKIFLEGSRFSAFEDYWRFHKKLMKRIHNYGVVVVKKFQALHPQVSTVLCNIADDTFSPYPRCAIILVMDINDYFTQTALANKQGVVVAEIYLQTNFGQFLDEETMADLMRVITGRSVVIKRERDLQNM